LGGDYNDTPNIIPLTGAPAIELRGVHTLFNSPIFYPPRPWSVNYYGALADPNGQVLLNLTPAQFKSDSPQLNTGILRAYENMSFRLFYSGYTGVGSDAAPPAILKVLSHASGGELSFRVTAVADIAAGVQEVWITYTDITTSNPQWKSEALKRDPDNPADWIRSISKGNEVPANTDFANIRFMAQAVNGVGLVTLSTNVGAYYMPDVDPGAPPPAPPPDAPPPPTTTLELSAAPETARYGAVTEITARLSSEAGPVPDATVALTFGFQSVQLTTNSDGEVTHTFLLDSLPGEYLIRASFAGNESYAPAEDETIHFVIEKKPTKLILAPTINGNVASFGGTLVDSDNNALGQQTVVFVLNRLDGAYIATLAAFTDPSGTAVPDVVSLPAGKYTVTAYFGQQVPNTDIDLTSQLYEASPTVPQVFDVGLVFTSSNQLEDFNQRSAVLSNKWQDRNTGSYRVFNNQLDIIAGGPLYWKDSPFGSSQGVQATFVKVDPNSSRQALLLKVQGSGRPDWQQGAIALVYDGRQHLLRVETHQPNTGQKWTAYSDLPLNLRDGDRLGAMIFSDGKVRIFLNGNLITTVTLNQSDQNFFNNRGGYIGLWFMAANEAVLDNFGGGTILP
jgi:hypothetical protein